jgi:hypothetical protein
MPRREIGLNQIHMRQRKQLIVVLLSLIATGCHGASNSSQNLVATSVPAMSMDATPIVPR